MLEINCEEYEAFKKCDVFRISGFSADWSIHGIQDGRIPMANLPPFMRVLLVTDGTITKTLEAFFWEKIIVENISQKLEPAKSDVNWLSIKKGESVLTRKVELRGGSSKSIYAKAFSLVRTSLIPAVMQESLISGRLGIGELIRDYRLETYRELLEIGLANNSSIESGDLFEGGCIYRTYRIIINCQPVILVSEYFANSIYPDINLRV